MKRAILLYSAVIAAAALVLQWLEYRYVVRALSTEVYIAAVAVGFTALGLWAGYRLTAGRWKSEFERNDRAIASLAISGRELEVLELLAEGSSNKEIADRLCLSPHTVKSHLGHLYDKLEVARRTQAVQKARELRILP
jgi:NarL family two-component system response regulator LiaR